MTRLASIAFFALSGILAAVGIALPFFKHCKRKK